MKHVQKRSQSIHQHPLPKVKPCTYSPTRPKWNIMKLFPIEIQFMLKDSPKVEDPYAWPKHSRTTWHLLGWYIHPRCMFGQDNEVATMEPMGAISVSPWRLLADKVVCGCGVLQRGCHYRQLVSTLPGFSSLLRGVALVPLLSTQKQWRLCRSSQSPCPVN